MISAPIAVRSLAVVLGLSRGRLMNVLSEYRDHFARPRIYVRDGRHLRRIRLLTPKDVRVLCALLRRPEPDQVHDGSARRARRRKRKALDA